MSDLFGRAVTRLGLGDASCRNLSFNKVVTLGAGLTFVGTVLYSMVSLRMIPPATVWTFGTIVICAGFGLKGLALGMARWTATNTQADSTALTGDVAKIIEAVKARRDPEKGTEAAP